LASVIDRVDLSKGISWFISTIQENLFWSDANARRIRLTQSLQGRSKPNHERIGITQFIIPLERAE
jgi:hypothetical protein